MVKVFVKGMVRGRKLEVVLKTGKRKACACSMSRGLDSLKIKLAGHAKSIGLADVEEIHVGSGLKRVDTPLDELCVTLILSSQDAVTFRFEDVEERDTFAACLLMFVQKAQGGEEEDEGILPTESEVAGFAGSEVAEEEQEEEHSSPTHMSSV
mmetsp:Transcript_36356/g.75862  ORF Transcript_36356/g.75862 Transcript_36356/m.75862 type:complete len:153 (+) Transcript_36356:2-460(+)